MTPEQVVQNAIEKYLDSLIKEGRHVWYEKRQGGGFSYKKGDPDLMVVVDGLHYEIEIKAPGGRQSSMQETKQRMFLSRGIPCYCVDSLEELKKKIGI